MRSLRDIGTIISNGTWNGISMRSALTAHRWVGALPKVLSFRNVAERYADDGGNIIRFLSYNTYLLDGVTFLSIGEAPALKDRANEIGIELIKTINFGQGLEKSYEIIALCEVWSSEEQDIIKLKTPQYNHIAGPGPGPVDFLVQKGSGLYHLVINNRKIVDNQAYVFSDQGDHRTDADAYSRKGVLLSRIDVGVGIIDLYNTHLYSGGGLLFDPSDEYRRETKNKQLGEFVQFFQRTHSNENIAIFCGDLNISHPNNNLLDSMKKINLDLINEKSIEGKESIGGTHNPNSNEVDGKDRFKDICCNSNENNIYCTIDGKGDMIDYIFLEKQTSDHSFMLDVSYLLRRPFPRSNPTDGEYFLSDHLGLDVILIASPKNDK